MTGRTGRRILGTLFALIMLSGVFFPFVQARADDAVALLEIGPTINNRMRFLPAVGNSEPPQQANSIQAIRMADSLPDGFVPAARNTVSAPESEYPVYIFYDNQDDAGIMYFYTEADRIVMNPDSSLLFSGYPTLTDISGVADWDSSRVTSMYAMFGGAKGLPDALALRNWDTSSVTDMRFMFANALSLMFVDVSNWDTGKVTSMKNMFQVGENYMGNGQLREIIGIGSLDVSNVTDMTCLFYGAGQMTEYNISGWDVSKVESMNHMFCDNFKLRSLNLSRWDVSSVKTMYCMFDDAQSLRTIGDVSHWNTSSLIDAGGWLNYAESFVGDNNGHLDLSGWDTSKLKTVGEMFLRTKIRTIDLSGWTFDSIINTKWEGAGEGIFYEYGNGSGKEVKAFGQMFMKTPNLIAVYLSKAGMESFNAAVEREVNIEDMWTDSKCSGFRVK